MYLVDSHCHLDLLDLPHLGGSLDAVVEAAHANGVGRILCVSIDLERFSRLQALAGQYDEVYLTVGVHPNESDAREPTAEEIAALAAGGKVLAIGETGLDYYRGSGDLGWQRARFRRHIAAARQAGLPLIVHTRDAQDDTLRLLREEGADRIGGVMHCFTGSYDEACAALDLGFYISFSGIVTFKNARQLQAVAARVPEDRLLIETDAPYLTPEPHRGQPNQPAYVRHVAECIARLRGLTLERMAEITYGNFIRLFKIIS